MHRKKKKITEIRLQRKLIPIYIRKKKIMSRQQQHYCFNKNKINITLRSFLTLRQERSLLLSLSLGIRNFFWYCDF